MSPGSPGSGGPKGPRRIDWDRLPGPDGPDDDPPPPPKRRGPRGPMAGGPHTDGSTVRLPPRGCDDSPTEQLPRLGDGGPMTRGTGAFNSVSGSFKRVTGAHNLVGGADQLPAGGPHPEFLGRSERPPGATGSHDRVTGAQELTYSKKGRPVRKPKEPESRLSQPHKRQYLSLWIELPLLLVVAFSAAVLLRTFAVQPFYIPSGSMEQTLQEGDKVLVLKLTQTLRTPQRGEVVVFRGTDSWDPEYRPTNTEDGLVSDVSTAVLDLIGLAEPDEKDFIKRVIAVGGDTVLCCDDDGNVVVNGVSLHEEEYVYDNAPLDVEPGTCHSRLFEEVTVPEGQVWVMGDHRGNSKDSRCQGPVPVENIIGRAISLVWPTERARNLEIPGSFAPLEGTTGTDGAENGGESGDETGEADTSDTEAIGAVTSGSAGDGHGYHPPPALPPAAVHGNGYQASPRGGCARRRSASA